MKRILGFVLSIALVLGMGFQATNTLTQSAKKHETKLKDFGVSNSELKEIASSKTAEAAASKTNALKGNDYEAAVHKVLDKYYKNGDAKNIKAYEAKLNNKGKAIAKDYKDAALERANDSKLKYEPCATILTFGADKTKSEIKKVVADQYGECEYIHKCTDGSYLTKVNTIGLKADKAAEAYDKYTQINTSEKNGKLQQTAEAWDMVNDPYRYNEYYLQHLNVGEAWSYINSRQHSKVKVCVIDGTGIDINDNNDLKNVSNKSQSIMYNENGTTYPMTSNSTYINTSNMHMVNGCGLIAAQSNNNSQIAGVAAGTDNSIVDLVSVGIPLYVDKMAVGIDYANSIGVKVVNLSLFHEGTYDAEEQAINRFTNNGGTVVAGAGNNGADLNGYPSDYGNVISIIATNEDKTKRGTSNFGWECDFCAPGTSIVAPGGRDETWVTNGTSMASPIAAGAVAMMYSVNPSLNKTQVHNILRETAQDLGDSGRDYYYAYGLINAGAAVKKAGGASNVQTQAPTQAPQTQAPTTLKQIDPNTASYKLVDGTTDIYYSEGSAATIVNVQNPGWKEGNYSGDGVYFHVPAGISQIKVNDGAGAHIEGAGGLVFLSALKTGVNKVYVEYAGGNTTFYIKNNRAAQTQAPTTTKTQVNDGTQLLKNINFNGADNWNDYSVNGATFNNNGNGSVTVNIPAYSSGESWHTQLIQSPLSLDSSKYYVVTYTVNSQNARKYQLLVQTTDYSAYAVNTTTQVSSGETKLVKAVFKPDRTGEYLFGVMMGYVDGYNSQATTATISNVSLKVYNTEEAARNAANNIAEPTTVAPTTKAPTTAAPTTKVPTTAAPTTKAPTTVAPTTKAQATQGQATEENPGDIVTHNWGDQFTETQTSSKVIETTKKDDYIFDFDPSTLTYETAKCDGGEDLHFSVYKPVTGLVSFYENAGNTFSMMFTGELGKATSVSVNGGEPEEGVVTESATGVVRINPTRLDDNAYNVVEVTFAGSEKLIFVVREGNPETPQVNTTVAQTTTVESTTAAPTTAQQTTTQTTTAQQTTLKTTTAQVTTAQQTTKQATTAQPTTKQTTTAQQTTKHTALQTTQAKTTAEVTTSKQNVISTVAPSESTAKQVNLQVKIKKATKKKSAKKLTIKIKKTVDAKGYYVMVYKTKKNAKKNKKAIFKKYIKKNKATLVIKSKKLANKKVLFVRVKAYIKVNDEVVFGKPSKIKKVKIK